MNTNIVLIGMPGTGKSTVGVLLAKRLVCDFVDTDVLIQRRYAATLAEIVAKQGREAFLAAEEQVLSSLKLDGHVVATGGSAVYSEAGMLNLKRQARVIFLDTALEIVEQRVGDLVERGVVRSQGQSLALLLEERAPLYQQYADLRIQCDCLTQQGVVDAIVTAISDAPYSGSH